MSYMSSINTPAVEYNVFSAITRVAPELNTIYTIGNGPEPRNIEELGYVDIEDDIEDGIEDDIDDDMRIIEDTDRIIGLILMCYVSIVCIIILAIIYQALSVHDEFY